jgi:hypothetical protein
LTHVFHGAEATFFRAVSPLDASIMHLSKITAGWYQIPTAPGKRHCYIHSNIHSIMANDGGIHVAWQVTRGSPYDRCRVLHECRTMSEAKKWARLNRWDARQYRDAVPDIDKVQQDARLKSLLDAVLLHEDGTAYAALLDALEELKLIPRKSKYGGFQIERTDYEREAARVGLIRRPRCKTMSL